MSTITREILTIVIVLQGLILVALLSIRRRNRNSNFFLAGYILIFIFLVAWKTYRGVEMFSFFSYSYQFPYTFWFILHPLSYFYVRNLINGTIFKKRDVIHLIPWLCSFIALWPYISLESSSKIEMWNLHRMSINSTFDFIFVLCIVLQGFLYSIAAAVLLIRHDRRILNLFSNIESIDLRWLRILVYYLILLHLLSLLAEFLMYYEIEQFNVLYDLSFYAVVLLIYIISYRALAQPQTFQLDNAREDNNPDLVNNEKYRNSRLSKEQSETYLRKIEKYMQEKEPYVNSHLSIDEMSRELNIPKHHISQILNLRLNKNFYNYVNEYRVEKTKQLMANSDSEKYSLLGLALQAGFNSKTSFNRIFKSIAGMTPSEYQKQIEE